MNYACILEEAARKVPDNVAIKTVIIRDEAMTYEELDRRVNRLANGLLSLGVAKGDRVAVYLPFNWPETVVAYFAAAKIAAIAVPIDSLYTVPEASYILADSGARVVVTTRTLWEPMKQSGAVPQDLQRAILVDDETAEDEHSIGFERLLARAVERSPLVECKGDEVLFLGYTSGTTGKPKGAMLTHANLLFQVFYGTGIIQVHPWDRVLDVVPLTHSYMYAAMLGQVVKGGATLVLMGRFVPDKCLEVIEKEKITWLTGSPTIFIHLLRARANARYDTSSLRFCATGGSATPAKVWQAFEDAFGVRIIEVYGLTETSVTVTIDNVDGRRIQESAGRPTFATAVKVVDEHGHEVPVGTVGEVVVKGPQVMKGYWNRPEETAQVLRQGWFYTGDLGYLNDEGYLFIVDRKKDMILTSGYNVYPREVEEVLYGHEGVLEAAVVGVPDEVRGERVKAYIVPRPDRATTTEDIVSYCRTKLAPYKVPREIEFVSQLPRTTIGKVQRFRLRG